MKKAPELPSRKVYLDAMRVIAIFLVIFNHLKGYSLYQISGAGLKTWIYMFATMITRMNVPLFFMISGILLLGRTENIRVVLNKRVSRILLVILFVSALKYILFVSNRSLGDFLSKVISGSIDGSYWFLYAYLGMLLMLPLTRKTIIGLQKAEFIYVVALHFSVLSLLPMVRYIVKELGGPTIALSGDMAIPLMTLKALFYPFIGYYLDRCVDIETIRGEKWLLIGAVALFGIILSSAFTYHEGINEKFTQNWVQLFDYVTAMAAFLMIKYLFARPAVKGKKTLNAAICRLGELTFGIYLLDPILKKMIYAPFEMKLEPYLPTIIVSLIWCLFSMTVGGMITYLLKMIPGLKKIL